MAENQEVFIDIQARIGKEIDTAVEKFKALTAEIQRLKIRQSELDKQLADGAITAEEYAEENARITLNIKTLRAEQNKAVSSYKSATSAISTQTGSLDQQRAQLSLLLKQWDALSEQERQLAENQPLKKAIDELTASVKEGEGETGRFQRNVGNYQSAFDASAERIERFGGIFAKIFGDGNVVSRAAKTVAGFGRKVSDASNTINDMAGGLGSATAQANANADATARMAGAQEQAGQSANEARTHVGGFGRASQSAAQGTATATTATGGLTVAVKALGKALLKLLANPIGLILVALAAAMMPIIAAFRAIVEQVKKNDAAMTSLQSLFAAFRPVLDLLKAGFAVLADVVGKVAEAVGGFVRGITNAIPFLRDYAQAEEDLVRATDALEEAQRTHKVAQAKRDKEVAELNAKSVQSEKYNLDQRKKFVQQAIDLEKKTLAEKKADAKEQLRLAKEQAELDKDTSDETADRIADLQVAVYNAEKEFNDGTRRLKSRMNTFEKEENDRVKKSAEEARKAMEERRKAMERAMAEEAKLRQEAEKTEVDLYGDITAAKIANINIETRNTIAELRKRLATEKDLTAESRDAINRLIVAKEKAKNLAVLALAKQHGEQLANMQRKNDELQVSLMGEGIGKISALYELQRRDAVATYENAKSSYGDELKALSQMLKDGLIARQDYTAQADHLGAVLFEAQVARDLAIDKAEREKEQGLTDYYRKQLEERLSTMETATAEQERIAGDNVYRLKEAYEDEAEQLRKVLDETRQLTEDEAVNAYGSLQGWRDAVEMLGDAYTDLQVKAGNATKQAGEATRQAQQEMLNNIGGGIQSAIGLFDELAKKNKDFAKLSEVLSYVNILTSSAQSIANAIKGATEAAAAGGPAAPYLIAGYIATAVATVASGITSAMQTHDKAKQALEGAKYNRGGVVRGAGTGTSDSVPARLSNGESVLTAKATAEHYEVLSRWNVEGGGRPFPGAAVITPVHMATGGVASGVDLSAMAEVFASAVAGIEPVVSVREINAVQHRVKVKEKSAKK